MTFTTLISVAEIEAHGGDPDWAMVDCRFRLVDPPFGRAAYLGAHVPGAVYAHLNDDLCGPIVPGVTGRHPLPTVGAFAATLSRLGIDERVQVVAYDDSGGSMAARLWWMLRWVGHEAAAVLDGGWQAWQGRGGPIGGGEESRLPRQFHPRERAERATDVRLVERVRADPAWRLLDARAEDRYRGENETIDPVAGHIPGAVSAPYLENLSPDGRFRPAAELRAHYGPITRGISPERVVCYCGSGVTAAHDVLAMVHAGLGEPRLYVGSWSDWITDPSRPVAKP